MNDTALATVEQPEMALAVQESPPDRSLTPAQARVESVARVMDAAMNKASTLILTPEENAGLEADFPDEAFKPGAAGKEHLIYIEHAHLRDRFNAVIGRGQWALMRTRPHWAEEYRTPKGAEAVRIYADCALLVRGCMVAEAIGDMVYYKNNDSQNYGDAAEGAVTAAFRRCAKNFGVGLQAWKKDFAEGWWARRKSGASRPQPAPQPVPAPAPSKTFKNASERQAAFDLHIEKCKLKLISNMEITGVGVTEEFLKAKGWILPNEGTADANTLTMFKSVPHAPDDRESDGDWWARVQETIARDAKAIQREFDAFARGDQLPDASAPEPEPQAEPEQESIDLVPDGALHLKIEVVHVSTKQGQSKKGPWTLYGVKDENGAYYNTFSKSVGEKALALKGQKATIFFTEGERGYTLHKIIVA